MIKKFFQYFILIILISISGIIWTNQEEARDYFQRIRRTYIERPCIKPIKYSIGSIDPRFDISKVDLQNAILSAETIWEKSLARNLFEYHPDAPLKISLIYDQRQQRTEESTKLENKLETLEGSHEAILDQYDNLSSSYKKRLDDYNKAASDYQKRLNQYNKDVNYWNAKGGAPSDTYDELKDEKKELQNDFTALEKERKAINALIGKTNELAEKEKSIVSDYNENLASYKNKYGEPTQFDKGIYDGKEIDIFQFNEIGDLRLTIAHEFGHTLGIDHLSSPTSLMYYLMGEQDLDNPQLSQEDTLALREACLIK